MDAKSRNAGLRSPYSFLVGARSRRPFCRLLAVAALSLALPSSGFADGASSRYAQTVGASLGLGPDRGTAAISWNHLYDVLPARLTFGVGARFTSLFASGALEFRTGDPQLIRDGRVNRFVIDDTSVSSFNLQILGILRLVGPLEAGFNLDLVGFSFGPRRGGDYGATDQRFSGLQEARVSSFDLFLVDTRDKGQLNSEFFLGIRLGPSWTVRAGLSHVATEYLTIHALDDGNRRFRRFTTQGFLGVTRRIR